MMASYDPQSVDECFVTMEETLYTALIFTNLRLTLCFDKVMEEYYVALYHTKKDGDSRSIALTLEEGKTLQRLLPKLVSLNSRCHGIWSKDVDKEKVLFSSENVRYTLLWFMGLLYVDIRKIYRKQHGQVSLSKIGVRLPLSLMFGLHQHLPECLKAGEDDVEFSKTKIRELIAGRIFKELNGENSKTAFEKVLATLNKTVVSPEGEDINGFEELYDIIVAQPEELYELVAEMNRI